MYKMLRYGVCLEDTVLSQWWRQHSLVQLHDIVYKKVSFL
jgi:hypothetical protein